MGPLDGVRVVDLSIGIAGPVAGMLLADYGAEVVKVEPPSGDPARARAGFAVWNRNKQGIVSDLAAPTGRQRVLDLIAGADVCIVGRPEIADALQAAATANERLVYLRMPPYLPSETPWAGGAESNELLCAIAGPSSRQSSYGGDPIHLVYPFPLYLQGFWAAACAVAALIERERSGLGQVVTVAGIHGALVASPQSFVIDPAQPPLPTDVGPGGRHPTYTSYKCGDGRWLFLAALIPKFQANAFEVLGVGDLFADPRIAGQSSRLVLPENRGWVRELLAAAFASRDRDEWLRRLEVGDCPAGPLGERDEWLDHTQIIANDLRADLADPERGRVAMPGLPIELSRTPGAVRAPAPRLGEHDATAGRWSPLSPGEGHGASPHNAGRGPLAGIRVLDLGTILAGPYAGVLLAELGADVVKVEAPAGDAFRETGFVYNRGMRGLAIDLSTAAGQAAFHRLAATVDVVLDNSRLGVSKRLRVDYPTLRDVNPRLVCLSVAGFGERGPFAPKPAFDPVLQAMSGIMAAQAGDSEPVLFTIPINDVCAAATSAFAICLGLYHRARTGQGQRAVTSLVASSLSMQSGELVRYADRPPSVRGGADFAGPSPADRFYRTADGWLRVQARSVASLRAALGLPLSPAADARPRGAGSAPTASANGADDAAAIGAAMAGLARAACIQRLAEAGIPAVPAHHPADLRGKPEIEELCLLAEHRLQNGTSLFMPHRYARFSRTEQDAIRDTPGVGEHSREVLVEAGLTDPELDQLIEQRAVIQGAPLVLRGLINYR